MTKEQFDKRLPLTVPANIAVCPICGDRIMIDEIEDWSEKGIGEQLVIDEHTTVSVDCVSAPDIDDDEFDDFMARHWQSPYADWMPVQAVVTKWLRKAIDQGTLQPQEGK